MKFYRSIGPIEAMSFDLDDTLYDNHSVMIALEAQFMQWLNQHASQSFVWSSQQWLALRRAALLANPRLKHNMTALRVATLELGLSEQGYPPHQRKLLIEKAMGKVYALRNNITVLPSVREMLSQLSAKIPLVAVTNGNVDCQAIGLTPYFTHVFSAGIDGDAKPAPDLFNKAANALQLDPQRILHVGDHLNSDVAGAIRAGFRTAWLNTRAKTVRDSRSAKLLPDIEIDQVELLLSLRI